MRSKTDTAVVNEALCKVLCHNICCLIQSMFELGVERRSGETANRHTRPNPYRLLPLWKPWCGSTDRCAKRVKLSRVKSRDGDTRGITECR